MNAIQEELEAEVPLVEEESSWEVCSEEEFFDSSEESCDEEY